MEEEPMIACANLDDLLLDGSPLAMETAARHAERCAACAETLASWNEISGTAHSMRAEWDDDLLWPRIERALQAEGRQQQRASGSSLWQIAAAAIFTIALGATMVYALRVQTRETVFDRHILRAGAVDAVERAEQAHVEAIATLEQMADPKLEEADSPLMMSYREKLMLLDDAIAECEEIIDRNRQNAHLRSQLLAMYSEKRQTLEDVLREDTNVSQP